ncbi:lysE type translocator family protein, partial [Vibrio parahaemolyticus VPTS-2010_2]
MVLSLHFMYMGHYQFWVF